MWYTGDNKKKRRLGRNAIQSFCGRNPIAEIVPLGDSLERLKVINFEAFRPELEIVLQKERKSNAGRQPYDIVMMFKILVLQRLFNLSDDQTEYQITDRMSFQRFIGLLLGERIPDAKTIWLFKDTLTQKGIIETTTPQMCMTATNLPILSEQKTRSYMPTVPMSVKKYPAM